MATVIYTSPTPVGISGSISVPVHGGYSSTGTNPSYFLTGQHTENSVEFFSVSLDSDLNIRIKFFTEENRTAITAEFSPAENISVKDLTRVQLLINYFSTTAHGTDKEWALKYIRKHSLEQHFIFST